MTVVVPFTNKIMMDGKARHGNILLENSIRVRFGNPLWGNKLDGVFSSEPSIDQSDIVGGDAGGIGYEDLGIIGRNSPANANTGFAYRDRSILLELAAYRKRVCSSGTSEQHHHHDPHTTENLLHRSDSLEKERRRQMCTLDRPLMVCCLLCSTPASFPCKVGNSSSHQGLSPRKHNFLRISGMGFT